MPQLPFKYLAFYRVIKDFHSEQAWEGAKPFQKGQLLQYQKTESHTYDMMELVYFLDWNSQKPLLWYAHSDTVYDQWQLYLEPAPRPEKV